MRKGTEHIQNVKHIDMFTMCCEKVFNFLLSKAKHFGIRGFTNSALFDMTVTYWHLLDKVWMDSERIKKKWIEHFDFGSIGEKDVG